MLLELSEHRRDSLEELDLAVYYPLQGQGLDAVLRHCPRLRSLRIEQMYDEEVVFDRSLLRNLTTFVHCAENLSVSAALAHIGDHCHSVQNLGITANALTDSDVAYINELRLPALRQIDIYGVHIDEENGQYVPFHKSERLNLAKLSTLRANRPIVCIRWNHNMSFTNASDTATCISDLFSEPVVF